jgi:coenzyme Q-binding protein COQ10
MPRHEETRYLPYTAEQMFELVADVARYGEFLPWVTGVRVRRNDETEMTADLIVGFKGLREQFTSRVVKSRPTHIGVEYVDGPLRHLHNDWTFTAQPDGGCAVHFVVDFSFRSSLFERLAGQVFDKALRKMIGAFEDRARALYGTVDGNNSSSARSVA